MKSFITGCVLIFIGGIFIGLALAPAPTTPKPPYEVWLTLNNGVTLITYPIPQHMANFHAAIIGTNAVTNLTIRINTTSK